MRRRSILGTAMGPSALAVGRRMAELDAVDRGPTGPTYQSAEDLRPPDNRKSPGRPWTLTPDDARKSKRAIRHFKYYAGARVTAQKLLSGSRPRHKRIVLTHRKGWAEIYMRE